MVLPDDPSGDPSVRTFDEDLLFVFSTEAGWVLVCETSVRLITGQDHASRIDLGDIVERARWAGEILHVEDGRGIVTAIAVTGNRLAVLPGQVPPGPGPPPSDPDCR